VRALAKGGRRLRSSFESALDLLTVCSIVLLRKSSGSLDLLTEAQVVQRFGRLRSDLGALYAGYYVAELLADWTQDLDPHPALFDEALATLRELGESQQIGLRVMRFEMVFLHELGYRPVLQACAACGSALPGAGLAFSAEVGGVLCPRCTAEHRGTLRVPGPVSVAALELLRALGAGDEDWRHAWDAGARAEVRHLLGGYVSYLRGRQPRLLPYLGG
jgi:DNA repair protein RecO (recombination protein O)